MLIEFAKLFAQRSTKVAILTATLLTTQVGISNAADCKLSTRHWASMHHAVISLHHKNGEETELNVRIADEPRERAAGNQHICPQVIDQNAILFVYPSPQNSSFHMNNVHAELDIGFFDYDGLLFLVMRMKPPLKGDSSSNIYSPGRDIKYALETKAGYFADQRLQPGEVTLKFH